VELRRFRPHTSLQELGVVTSKRCQMRASIVLGHTFNFSYPWTLALSVLPFLELPVMGAVRFIHFFDFIYAFITSTEAEIGLSQIG